MAGLCYFLWFLHLGSSLFVPSTLPPLPFHIDNEVEWNLASLPTLKNVPLTTSILWSKDKETPGWIHKELQALFLINHCYRLVGSFSFMKPALSKDTSITFKLSVLRNKLRHPRIYPQAFCNATRFPWENIVGVVSIIGKHKNAHPTSSPEFNAHFPVDLKVGNKDFVLQFQNTFANFSLSPNSSFSADIHLYDPVLATSKHHHPILSYPKATTAIPTTTASSLNIPTNSSIFDPSNPIGKDFIFKIHHGNDASHSFLYGESKKLHAFPYFQVHQRHHAPVGQSQVLVNVLDFSYDTMFRFLEYIHSGQVSSRAAMSSLDWLELSYAADFYGVSKLQVVAHVNMIQQAIRTSTPIPEEYFYNEQHFKLLKLVQKLNQAFPLNYTVSTYPFNIATLTV